MASRTVVERIAMPVVPSVKIYIASQQLKEYRGRRTVPQVWIFAPEVDGPEITRWSIATGLRLTSL